MLSVQEALANSTLIDAFTFKEVFYLLGMCELSTIEYAVNKEDALSFRVRGNENHFPEFIVTFVVAEFKDKDVDARGKLYQQYADEWSQLSAKEVTERILKSWVFNAAPSLTITLLNLGFELSHLPHEIVELRDAIKAVRVVH